MPISYEGPEVISDHTTMICKGCLPTPSISIESTDPRILNNMSADSPATEYPKYNFSLKVDKLQPDRTYHYSIEAIDSEWPTFFVGKTSGVINTTKSTTASPVIIPGSSQLVFCESTGLCPNTSTYINSYTIPEYPEFWNAPSTYSVTLKASLTCDDCFTETIYSDPVTLSFCTNCLSQPQITIDKFDASNLVIKNNESPNFLFGLNVSNLQKYQTYNYAVDVIRAEWPTFFVGKTSGTIETDSDTNFPIFSPVLNKLVFCESTGLCPSGSQNVNPYEVPEYNNLWKGSGTYDVVLRASLDCISSAADTIYSEPVVVSFCNNCLPEPKVSLSGTPVTLNSQSPNFSFGIDFSGLQKDQTYNYSVDIIKSEWPTFFVGKTSGVLDLNQDTNLPISPIFGKLVFCKSPALCPSGAEYINDYSVPEYPKLWTGSGKYDVILRATLNRVSQPASSVYSNPILISYETELPKPIIPDISLSLDTK